MAAGDGKERGRRWDLEESSRKRGIRPHRQHAMKKSLTEALRAVAGERARGERGGNESFQPEAVSMTYKYKTS